jgi:hypothetical protein
MAAPPPPVVIRDPQIASIQTAKGVQLYQFTGHDLIGASWSREPSEVSRCKIDVPSNIDFGKLPDIIPWLHWVLVWDADSKELLWRGPVQDTTANKQSMSINCRDMMAFAARTRTPISKRWEAEAPEDMAAELLAAMIDLHGLNVTPVVRYDPDGDRFDYTCRADEGMLDNNFEELVHLGLQWTVVAGVPILGPQPRTAIVALDEEDFVGGGGLSLVRDGANSYNDILLRAATDKARAKAPMGGLNLQKIYNADSVSGVSNTDRAAKQAARYTSRIRDRVELPDDAVLHPNAPLTINQLIPTARVNIQAFDRVIPMELAGIDVSFTPQTSSVRPRFTDVDDDLPELITLEKTGSMSGTGG